jgi:hypothetical protein
VGRESRGIVLRARSGEQNRLACQVHRLPGGVGPYVPGANKGVRPTCPACVALPLRPTSRQKCVANTGRLRLSLIITRVRDEAAARCPTWSCPVMPPRGMSPGSQPSGTAAPRRRTRARHSGTAACRGPPVRLHPSEALEPTAGRAGYQSSARMVRGVSYPPEIRPRERCAACRVMPRGSMLRA